MRKEALMLRAKSSEKEYTAPESEAASTPRWLPVAVVGVAVVSFVGLAWYAYHAGSRSVKEEDLVLIEADKTPMKEKPEDPGGMKFPHQDKTIFDAISGNPSIAQQGERVMPAPEEPMNREQVQATGDASTWVNDKLKADGPAPSAVPEPVIPATPDLAAPVQPVLPGAPLPPPSAPNAQISAAVSSPQADIPAPAAPVETLPLQAAEASPAAETAAPVELKAVAKETAKAADDATKQTSAVKIVKAIASKAKPASASAPAAGGKGNVQLGAYKSEAEAKTAWNSAVKKHKELAGLTPAVVKADLGAKGVFYRLRVSVPNAREFCSGLAAKNQACMPIK